MLDIKFVRENREAVAEAIKNKGLSVDLARVLVLDEKRRELTAKIETARAEQKRIGRDDVEKAKLLKEEQKKLETDLGAVLIEYEDLMMRLPTVPSPDTPLGRDADDNVEILTWGEIPRFDFASKDHIQLGRELDILDLERGAKVGGFRGYYLKNEGAQLVMAAMLYSFNKMIASGYAPMIVPTLVREFALRGSGYFRGREYDAETDEIYQLSSRGDEADGEAGREKKFLVGTAEPSLLSYYADEILREEDLPARFCGFSQCYRSEIGSYGKDTKGVYRVHEFMKVEQVVFAPADIAATNKLQEEMIGLSRGLHEDLGLPYRLIQICAGDMSPGKYRAFDLEAWLPGLNRWGETCSASNFLDWQARRLNVRYKTKDGKIKFAYLLNNTALASPRTLIAILENYQQADGSVIIPEVLRSYMGGKEIIRKRAKTT